EGGRHLRHEDERIDAEAPRDMADGDCMVAARRRDDTALALVFGQGEELVVAAADLEGAGVLQPLELDDGLDAESLRNGQAHSAGRPPNAARDPLLGRLDIGEGDVELHELPPDCARVFRGGRSVAPDNATTR